MTGQSSTPYVAARPVAAVFDLDKTITRRATFIPFLLSVARRDPRTLIHAAPIAGAGLAYKLGLVSRARVKEIMLSGFLGTARRPEVSKYADDFVAACIARGLRPGALRAIAAHRDRGHALILATASFDFYVEPLGRELGFGSIIATRSAWDGDDRLLGRIEGENCYGAEKLRRLEEALPELRSSHLVVAYSDSHVDLPMLRWAHRGVAVNPSRRLRRCARAEGLEIVDWNAAPR